MLILVINAGSSSLKYQLVDTEAKKVMAKGLCERVGASDSFHKHGIDADERVISEYLPDHHAAINSVLRALTDDDYGVIDDLSKIDAVGHRVVHGGEYFDSSVVIDEKNLEKIAACSKLAPLHNPAAVEGIRACQKIMPEVMQVAVFDTSFHQSMPQKAYMYPLPYELYRGQSIRKYGFHGTSHRYVADRAAQFLGKPLEELQLITCHLGNGCSLAAIDHAKSVDTTMGFTPLDGLMMGTRCGSIDPAIVLYLINYVGLTSDEVNDIMNKQSGLLGISGLSNDLRDVRSAAEAGNDRAQLAYEMYSYSVKKHIGAYVFTMAGVDAIILTAGVGENCDRMRRMIFEGLEPMGIKIDHERNLQKSGERVISTDDSRVKILVIPTNEEYMIAQDVKHIYQELHNEAA
ncbi:MAG: acetate kinase [Coriobacteriales bacterium]|jgi:acetate kinase|nr:acetate kinase [Coriobacteriales bacterium]